MPLSFLLHIFGKMLWRVSTLLGNDGETNETTEFARQMPAINNGITVRSGILYVIRTEAISRDRPSSVQSMQRRRVDRSELIRE
jgi:hypothetical protein